MGTNEALKNAIDDSTTQSFGTDASNVGTEENSTTSKERAAAIPTNHSKHFA
jgi:hypothetical protein